MSLLLEGWHPLLGGLIGEPKIQKEGVSLASVFVNSVMVAIGYREKRIDTYRTLDI